MLSNHRGFPRSVFQPGLAGLLAVFLFTFSPPGRGAAVVTIPGGIGAEYVAPAPAINVTFRFEIVDLADTTPGQDLWEYSYIVSGLTLTAGQGFTIFFDLGLYTLLQNPPPFVNADFDLLVAQPDTVLNSHGFYDALALRDNPSFADPFKLRVVWLGTAGTTPGPQPYTVYNADFSTQSQGQTTNIPEPSALALLVGSASFGLLRLVGALRGRGLVRRGGRTGAAVRLPPAAGNKVPPPQSADESAHSIFSSSPRQLLPSSAASNPTLTSSTLPGIHP